MPLQKLPHTGPLNQRPQLHHRRKTLQTISELSTNEAPGLPDFVSSIGIESIRRIGHDSVPGVARIAPNPAIQESLPQQNSSSTVHASRPSITVTPTRGHEVSGRRPGQGRRPMPITAEQAEGWNAKRERARMRHELAYAEARAIQSKSDLRAEAATNSRSSSFDKGSNQHTLLQGSKSFRLSNGETERSASLRSTNNSASQYDMRHIASERTSTDSSSYQSRDSAIYRSRSVSSSTSYTSQNSPALPTGTTTDMKGSCAEVVSQKQNLVAFGESARSKTLQTQRSSRTMSLPAHGSTVASAPHKYMTATDLRQLPAQQGRPMSAQRARNQALAALTAANSHMRTTRTNQYSQPSRNSAHYNRHASLTSHPPNTSTHRNSQRRQAHFEAQRRITSPSPAHLPERASRSSLRRQSTDQPRRVSFEARTVPKRESLTQWKKEREHAMANLKTDHKARIQERVRRANEQELEREKELVQMRKKRSGGCFGGLLGLLRGGSG